MKNINTHLVKLSILSILLIGCDKGFTELNTNKVDPTSLNPAFGFNNSVINFLYNDTGPQQSLLTYNFGIVQQVISPFGSSIVGANYNQVNRSWITTPWNEYYPNVVKDIVDVLSKTQGVDEQSNLYNSARIWKAYVFMVLTDDYGDIPYFDAGKGYLDETFKPNYDPQQEIYKDILKELEEATGALDSSLPLETNEILYGGDIVKWKRFGYSLMLRAAMRLTEVDPALAESYVVEAVNGGLMESNDDNAVVRHSGEYINWLGETLNGRERATFFIAEPFVKFLSENNDPRLPVFSIRFVGALNGNEQVPAIATSDPDMQVGMPIGYDDVSITSTFAENGVASIWDYSQVNRTTVGTTLSPQYFVTYSQTQLLLAEAIIRKWIPGDATAVFEEGIRGNMRKMSEYGDNAAIAKVDIDNYIAAHPLDLNNALEQINTQYWVSSFLDGPEVWANFRRSGYPALTPNPYPGSELSGDFINRFIYPDSEYVVNKENVEAAISRQGPDTMDTKVWWDKE